MELETEEIKPDEIPTPATPLPKPAGFVRRAIAFMIDLACLGLLYLVPFTFGLFGLYLSEGDVTSVPSLIAPFVSLWSVLFIGYFTFFHIHSGQTPGKRIIRITVVGKEGELLSHWVGFLRSFASFFFLFFFPIGFFMAMFGEKKRALHDMLIGSQVVFSQD